DALEPAADRRGHRPFERYLIALNRFVKRRGNVFSEDLKRLCACCKSLPLPFHAGRFQDANNGLRYFRPNAISGNQRNFMRHFFLALCPSSNPSSSSLNSRTSLKS